MVAVDPDQPSATPHWTITLAAPYCGGYRVGDGVYLNPESPLALPQAPPDGSVLFAGEPASIVQTGSALRISPAPGIAHSMICLPGDRSLTVELLPQAGLSLPDAPGTYAVDVWTGDNPTPITLSFDVAAPQEPDAGWEPAE